jgi:hypothetical protein
MSQNDIYKLQNAGSASQYLSMGLDNTEVARSSLHYTLNPRLSSHSYNGLNSESAVFKPSYP